MASLLQLLLRGVAASAILATSLAIAAARIVPRTERQRTISASPYWAVNRLFFDAANPRVRILDAESGCITNMVMPTGENLQYASFSDWVDESGNRQVVGIWSHLAGRELEAACLGLGLSRVLYPSGVVLDRINDLPALPSGAPCWYPGTEARILYPAGDGRLYQYAFEVSARSGRPTPDDGAVPVPWSRALAANPMLRIQEICWPKDPRFHGKLFATVSSSVCTVEGQKVLGPTHIWWLTLSGNGNMITAGGPLASARPDPEHLIEQCAPSLTVAADGTPVLVYHERIQGERVGEARMVRLEFDPETGVPAIRPEQSVRAAGLCKPVPAAFTRRGDGFFLYRSNESGQPMLTRYAVAGLLAPRTAPLSSVPR